jgi:hypothetical protein
MTSAKVWLRGLFQKTVWSHYNTANIPPRFHLIYTFVLPFKYLSIFLYGALSVPVSISSIDLVFGNIYGDIWSIALMLGGLLALLGICFYARLIWVEVVANVALVTLMMIYVGCILVAFLVGAEEFRFLSLLLVILFLPMPCWRVLDIVRELRPAREL